MTRNNITAILMNGEIREKIANEQFNSFPTKANARKALSETKHLNGLYRKAQKLGVLSYGEVVKLVATIGNRKCSLTKRAEEEFETFLLTRDCMAEEAADWEDGAGEF